VRNEWEICVYCGANQQVVAPRRMATARPPAAVTPAEETEETLPYRPVRVGK
jgi:hypothetical protein